MKDKPTFQDIAQEWIDFIGDDARLIAHNADFDRGFINAELERAGYSAVAESRFFDTLPLAKERFPGQKVSLDALCKKYSIDNTKRVYHGALLDSELLLEVYIELKGGRQKKFTLVQDFGGGDAITRGAREKRVFTVSAEEKAVHQEFLETITDPIWHK